MELHVAGVSAQLSKHHVRLSKSHPERNSVYVLGAPEDVERWRGGIWLAVTAQEVECVFACEARSHSDG